MSKNSHDALRLTLTSSDEAIADSEISIVVAFNVTALLLDHEYLFTPMILNFPLGLLCLVTLFIIRPAISSDPQPGDENEQDEEGGKRVSSIRRSIRILSQLLRNRNVLVLLATVPVAKLVNPITELMFQYIPRKFDLSLASVSFPHTHIPCSGCLMF
jgi:hypothetical protein